MYMPSSLSLCSVFSTSMPTTLISLCFTMIKPHTSLPQYKTTTAASDHHAAGDSDGEPSPDPDFATAYASKRFFFSSPGRSNSILNSSSINSTSSSTLGTDMIADGTIAVQTYSPDPFMDFRRSMQEMVEAREVHGVQQDWDYLQELLMCYLSLNKESMHKFIVGAFGDLLVSLMTSHLQLEKDRK